MSAVLSNVPGVQSARGCHTCSTRGQCLAVGVDPKLIGRFETLHGPVRILRRGDALFRAGTPFESVCIVRSGSFKVSMSSADGDEQITGFHLPGEMLGIDAIHDGSHRTTAIALETSSVCGFPFERLGRLAKESPELDRQLWRLASRELAARQEHLLLVAHRDAEAKLAAFLLSVSARLERMGFSPVEFRLSMGRQEIGAYLGLTLETVSRLFTRFQECGLIRRDRRLVRLLDVAGLRAKCGAAAAAAQVQHSRPEPLPARRSATLAALPWEYPVSRPDTALAARLA
jgi:CRP/FNR family transcriptional regulator